MVYGDSVTWGQGHKDGNKFATQVASALGATVKMIAHSGATIGRDDAQTGSCGPESPNHYPTILQQLATASDDPDQAALVIVDGGINDIGVPTILSPITSNKYLRNVTRRYCHDDMLFLLMQSAQRPAPRSPHMTESEGFMRPFIAATVALLTFSAGQPNSPSGAARAEQPAAAASTQLTVLSSNGFQAVMEDLAPRFENAKHQKLAVTYDLASTLRLQIENGQPFDLAILTPAAIDDLIKSGKVAAGSRTPLARAGLGLAVRAGARKPNIATNESFTRALKDAKSIAYVKEGASGVAFAALVKRLGMTDALQPNTRLTATRDEVGDALRNGNAELGAPNQRDTAARRRRAGRRFSPRHADLHRHGRRRKREDRAGGRRA